MSKEEKKTFFFFKFKMKKVTEKIAKKKKIEKIDYLKNCCFKKTLTTAVNSAKKKTFQNNSKIVF